MWELKNRNIDYTIKWKLLKRAKPYNCASNRCNLCLWEKYFIICKPKMATLNKRNELVSACRHNKKFLLSKGRVNPKLRVTEQRLHTGHFTINLWQTIYHLIANELKILKNIFLDTKTALLLATRQLKWQHAVSR